MGKRLLPTRVKNILLTDTKIKNAKAREKSYRLTDGLGLHLLVHKNGSKLWQVRYRYENLEKTASLGPYPLVSLAEARVKRDELKKLLLEGKNPAQVKRLEETQKHAEAASKFQAVSEQWYSQWSKVRSPRHAGYVKRRLESDVFPDIGELPISALRPLDVVRIVKKIDARGATDIAKRAFQMIGAICRYAVAHGMIERDPTQDVRPSDILVAKRPTNYARIDASELPDLMHAIEGYSGASTTRLSLRLLALTFVRTSELIAARWDEIHFEEANWRIPAERMKMRSPHVVPLSRQALEALRTLHLLTGHSKLLFPGERDRARPMSNNTILKALERLGFKGRMTGHGFRGLASTILHEHGFEHAHIEAQLAHQERDRVSASYNHAQYLRQRAEMMQWWADRLDAALGRNVVPMSGRRSA